MQKADAHFNRMMETSIPKLITSLAVPTVISMLVNNIYNMADTYFVSRLGTSASGAVGITATLSLVLLTLGLTFGHGAGSVISRALGSGDTERTHRLVSTAFFVSFGLAALVSVLCFTFFTPFLRLLGSTETVLPYAKDYCTYLLISAPFFVSSYVLNNIMRYEGKAHLAMVGLTAGAVLNIVLDPILIFGLKLGVAGAGISTAFSQVVSFFVLLFFFAKGKTNCRLHIKFLVWKEVPSILKNGLPTLARQGMNCISSMLLNQGAGLYGDAALSAVSIVNQICNLIFAIMIGIGQGFQPFAGFHYGAKRFDRLRQGFYFTFLLGEAVLLMLSFLFFFAAKPLISTFREDPAVISIGIMMLRLYCISLIAQPYCTCANMMFQSIGETGRASLLATARNGLYLIPLLLLLPRFWGQTGLLIAQPVADVLAFATAVPLVLIFFKGIKKKTD